MKAFAVLAAAVLVSALLAGVISRPRDTGQRMPSAAERARVDARRERPPTPSTAPRAAAEQWAARRVAAPGIDPQTAYATARRAMAGMRRYSSRRAAWFDPAAPRARAAALDAALDAWEALGPGNIGGRTRALAIHPKKPRIMYAGGVSGGVWKTTNNGRRWRPVGDVMSNIAVNALALDPADPRTIYAGTGEGYFREVVRGTGLPLRGAGIFRSDNGGASWERLPATRGRDFLWVNDLVVSVHDSARIYAATRRGVLRSLDGGASWKRVLKTRVKGGCLDLAYRGDTGRDVLFAACGTLAQGSVYRTLDAAGDEPWRTVLSEPGMARTSLAIAPSRPEVVYALAASNVPGPGGRFEQALHALFRSDRGGDPGSWEARVRNSDPQKVNTLLLSNPVLAALVECGFTGPDEYFAMGWYVNAVAVDPSDAERVWVSGVDAFRSDDGGRSFSPASYWWISRGFSAWVHADQHALVFHPKKSATLFSLGDGGIARTGNARAPLPSGDAALCGPSPNGPVWRSLNNDYGVTQFYHGTPYPDGRSYLGGTQDNGTVRGADSSGRRGWAVILGGDGGYSAIDPRDTRVIYASAQGADVRKSVNGGQDFFPAVNGIDDLDLQPRDFRAVPPGFLFIAPLVMAPSSPDTLWLGGRRLWRTEDGAGSWSAASTPLAGGGKASALAIAAADPDQVLAGADNGFIYRNRTASNATATVAWAAARPRRGFVTSVAFDPVDPGVAYATYGGFGGRHVWRSGDGGAGWRPIDGSGANRLPDIPAHSIIVDPADRDRLYVGTDLGVFVSLDSGAGWAVENTGFAAAVTESLSVVDTGATRLLFAFTHGRGAWRVEL